nr:MAG TPA: hypothetical protein [Caudoviricetes sp.]
MTQCKQTTDLRVYNLFDFLFLFFCSHYNL